MSTATADGRRNNGGAREGAGRKPKALRYADAADAVEQRIADALPDVIDALIGKAREGDLSAAKYLCDRLLGRVAVLPAVPASDERLPMTDADYQDKLSSQESSRRSNKHLQDLLDGFHD